MTRYKFGSRSLGLLATCHDDIQQVMHTALSMSPFDFTIICGHRGEEEQNNAFATGVSKVRFPDSKHNANPSNAVDVAPWIKGTINWNDEGSFYVLAGVILAAAKLEGVELRYGGDWDRDGLTEDQSFMDIGHFERIV